MEIISMHELEKGDIYTEQVRLHGRQAFLVKERLLDDIIVVPRNDPREKSIKRKIQNKDVVRLRHIDL